VKCAVTVEIYVKSKTGVACRYLAWCSLVM